MCYSAALRANVTTVQDHFKVAMQPEFQFEPYYHLNGFTHQNLYIIPQGRAGELVPAMWGLVPDYGVRDPQGFYKKYNTLNAKSETVFKSNTFKKSIWEKRCLIVADGFYEPHHKDKNSFPFFCQYPDEGLFAFAGIYNDLDTDVFSCSIITAAANPFFEKIHNKRKRMPLVLDRSFEQQWIQQDLEEPHIKELMKIGFTTKEFEAYPVTKAIYKRGVDTNTPEIVQKVHYPELNDQASLF